MMRWLFALMISVLLAGPTHAGEVDVGDWELISVRWFTALNFPNCDVGACSIDYEYFTGNIDDDFEVKCIYYMNNQMQGVYTSSVINGMVRFLVRINIKMRDGEGTNKAKFECEDDSWW